MKDSKKEGSNFKNNLFSKIIKTGKRVYYIDVKETQKGDSYITITEKKRKYRSDGSYKNEKHKIFLYREDFNNFANALDEAIDFVEVEKPENVERPENTDLSAEDFTADISFDDL